jgi:hypothetical protein
MVLILAKHVLSSLEGNIDREIALAKELWLLSDFVVKEESTYMSFFYFEILTFSVYSSFSETSLVSLYESVFWVRPETPELSSVLLVLPSFARVKKISGQKMPPSTRHAGKRNAEKKNEKKKLM